MGQISILVFLLGSYILASNIVEFNIPTYLGLYPSFLVLWS